METGSNLLCRVTVCWRSPWQSEKWRWWRFTRLRWRRFSATVQCFRVCFQCAMCWDLTQLLRRCSLDRNITSCVIPLRPIRPTDSYLLPLVTACCGGHGFGTVEWDEWWEDGWRSTGPSAARRLLTASSSLPTQSQEAEEKPAGQMGPDLTHFNGPWSCQLAFRLWTEAENSTF